MEHQHSQHVAGDGWSYAKFVRRNPIGARSLESLLQYAGFFAPTRWADRDLAIESGYAAASLASLMHSLILLNDRLGDGLGPDGPDQIHSQSGTPGSTIEHCSKPRTSSSTTFAERMRVILAMITNVQVVLEKLSRQHGGERRRRQAIIYVEALKAVSRLLLLAFTGEMMLAGGVYVPGKPRSPQCRDRAKRATCREVNLAERSTNAQHFLEADSLPSTLRSPEIYTGRRSGVRFVIPPRASFVWRGRGRSSRGCVGRQAISGEASYSQRKPKGPCTACQTSSDSFTELHETEQESWTPETNGRVDGGDTCYEENPQQRQTRLSSRYDGGGKSEPGFSQAWLMAGEVSHILRPLVYSYSCGSTGERSWRPWLVSLGMDVFAYACTARAGGGKVASLLPVRSGVDGQGVPILPFLDSEEAAELKRRKLLWFLYLMRSPAFQLLVEPLSRGAAGVFEGVPLLGGMVTYAVNMLLYVQRHHFYISAS